MDPRRYSAFVALSASALLILAGLLVSGIVPFSTPGNSVGLGPISSSATGNFDQLVVVLMENHNLNEIYGPAPYMTQLADQYAFSEGWSSITNPSQPNYIALLGASTFGVSGDGNHPNLNHPTLVDLIETSGHTWNAIAEGSGSGCSINPDRGEDHFPFLSYTTITGSAARCASLHSGGPTDVVAALNAGTNFIWFTPTDQHNMHDNSVASGDSWLQSWVPGLLTAMGSKKAALIIMFDEAYTSPPYIYMSFSGTATKLAYKSTASYSHYSLAKLLEDVWGGGSHDHGDERSAGSHGSGGGDDHRGRTHGPVHVLAHRPSRERYDYVRRVHFDGLRSNCDLAGPLGLGVRRHLGHLALLDPDRAACVRGIRHVHGDVADPGLKRVLGHGQQGDLRLRIGRPRRRSSSRPRIDRSDASPGTRTDLHRERCAVHRGERRSQRDGDDRRSIHYQ